jgi:acetyl esterase/lipase
MLLEVYTAQEKQRMNSIILIFTFCVGLPLLASLAAASAPVVPVSTTQPSEVIPLWHKAAPGALGTDPLKDVPTLTVFLPSKAIEATSTLSPAMVICPGGGYAHLAPHEGKDYAMWLNQHGIAGLVLKYRLGSAGYRHPVMMEDIQRAVRLTRFRAAQWNIDPRQVGVMGSSAGGHLASTALTHFDTGEPDAPDPVDRLSCRPDLGVLCYPVITMGAWTHSGSAENLLGKNPSLQLVALLSSELQVTPDTPPCFIWATADDHVVSVQNSLAFAQALAKNKVPFEIHIYQHGPHGQGLGIHNYDPATSDQSHLLPWTHDLILWLKIQHFVK